MRFSLLFQGTCPLHVPSTPPTTRSADHLLILTAAETSLSLYPSLWTDSCSAHPLLCLPLVFSRPSASPSGSHSTFPTTCPSWDGFGGLFLDICSLLTCHHVPPIASFLVPNVPCAESLCCRHSPLTALLFQVHHLDKVLASLSSSLTCVSPGPALKACP